MLAEILAKHKTKILFEDEEGVIVTLSAKSANVVPVMLPVTVFVDCTTCKIAPAPRFAAVTAPAAIMSASTMPSGNPPTETPVIVPSPSIVIGMIS
tara:strand:- start:19280 stop:19567 length:288 start_codon:yes stop_codon:yes gene_type:complete